MCYLVKDMIIRKKSLIIIILGLTTWLAESQENNIGAHIPWTTFEAEHMRTNGVVLQPKFEPFNVETESSGQQAVKLTSEEEFVEFTSSTEANSMVIRYSLPDAEKGGGLDAELLVYKNKELIGTHHISSRLSRLYGIYPFTNDPRAGKKRNFYDELRIKDLQINDGDVIQIRAVGNEDGDANYVVIDLVDLELVASPLEAPENSLSITDIQFKGDDSHGDYTEAFRLCISRAAETGQVVWIPPGDYKVTGDIVIPSNIIITGAGMWYSRLVGVDVLYRDVDRRVRLIGDGDNIHLSDFAIIGKLNYRDDSEANDGIVGSFGTNSSISRIWVEHTKAGVWVDNSKNLTVEDCRFRNTIADGVNFCVGMRDSTMVGCTARGTGDDSFAIWPATFKPQKYEPGHNLILNCTAQLPFLANGASIYGGDSNRISKSFFSDITQGSAILVSTTFPTQDESRGVNNNFSGITVIENCYIETSGGFDHTWGWRSAVQICVDNQSISGIQMKDIEIERSLSQGLTVIARERSNITELLTETIFADIKISDSEIGADENDVLWYPEGEYETLIPKWQLQLRTVLE